MGELTADLRNAIDVIVARCRAAGPGGVTLAIAVPKGGYYHGGRHRAPEHEFVPLGKGNTHDGCRYIINLDHPAEMYCGLTREAHR